VKDSKAPKKAVAAVPASLPSLTKNGTRYYEFHDDKSDKFWEITVTDLDVMVRFGRIGTQGQSQAKSFANADAVEKHVTKLVDEKTTKGYVESTGA
jgi:predicted DNA-binding WGR domain protein